LLIFSMYKRVKMEKAEFLAKIQEQWQELMAFIDPLSPEQMMVKDAGGWTIKDNLAHISAWERFITANQFEGQTAPQAFGLPADEFARLDEAGYNAIILQRNLDRPLGDVLTNLTRTHAALIERLEALSEEDLHTLMFSVGVKPEEVMTWIINNTFDHYAEHLRTIQANIL
jgi:hypothetical protein